MIYEPQHIAMSVSAMQGLNWMSKSLVNTLAIQTDYSPFYGKKFRASDGAVFEYDRNTLVKEYSYDRFLKEYKEVYFIREQ